MITKIEMIRFDRGFSHSETISSLLSVHIAIVPSKYFEYLWDECEQQKLQSNTPTSLQFDKTFNYLMETNREIHSFASVYVGVFE